MVFKPAENRSFGSGTYVKTWGEGVGKERSKNNWLAAIDGSYRDRVSWCRLKGIAAVHSKMGSRGNTRKAVIREASLEKTSVHLHQPMVFKANVEVSFSTLTSSVFWFQPSALEFERGKLGATSAENSLERVMATARARSFGRNVTRWPLLRVADLAQQWIQKIDGNRLRFLDLLIYWILKVTKCKTSKQSPKKCRNPRKVED